MAPTTRCHIVDIVSAVHSCSACATAVNLMVSLLRTQSPRWLFLLLTLTLADDLVRILTQQPDG